MPEVCDTVITCLPSPSATQHVLADKDGILAGLAAGAHWIEMGTLGREEILRFAEMAQQHGVRTMESPVTGGVHLAAHGDMTILAGGDKDMFDTHLPAFKAMGNKIFHMGPLGSAAVIKVITNMLAFIHLKAVGEALMLAKRGGLDLAQTYHAIAASSGNSFVHETEGQLVLSGSYDIDFTVDLSQGSWFRHGLRARIRCAARSCRANHLSLLVIPVVFTFVDDMMQWSSRVIRRGSATITDLPA